MMFALPRLKREDRSLRGLAMVFAGGILILLGGLWLVQIAFAARFEDHLKRQSFRTVAIPALRGRILDRNGRALAENRPRYNAVIYLEGLQGRFDEAYTGLAAEYRHEQTDPAKRRIDADTRRQLQWEADALVVSNLSRRVDSALGGPDAFDAKKFLRHYTQAPYVPYPIARDLEPRQVAIFAEQFSSLPAIDLETQPVRSYPRGSLAAHLLGFVQRKDAEAGVGYSLPEFEGRSGIEKMFDADLSGEAGVKSVLVNNLSYRQREEIESPSEPGADVYLTIDMDVQRAAESALAGTRGAAVVMDVRNGDVLAMASCPTFDPNGFVQGVSPSEWQRMSDPAMSPQLNRAVNGAYAPGSTFKIITSIALLEAGLDCNEVYDSPGEYRVPGYGHAIGDEAGPGKFNFERAFYKSSNTYFIHYGMKVGLRKLLEVAKRFHLGEKTDVGLQEAAGYVPTPDETAIASLQHSLPDVCIGQEITVTPLQMAVFTSAIANGGKIFWPRVASKLVAPDADAAVEIAAPGRVRDVAAIQPDHLALIRRSMLDVTERYEGSDDRGTAYDAFHSRDGGPLLGNFRVAGKTGTAEVKNDAGKYKTTWFISYGPFESPRYAVVVMVDHGDFGGPTCGPLAVKIYEALIRMEQRGTRAGALAVNN